MMAFALLSLKVQLLLTPPPLPNINDRVVPLCTDTPRYTQIYTNFVCFIICLSLSLFPFGHFVGVDNEFLLALGCCTQHCVISNLSNELLKYIPRL